MRSCNTMWVGEVVPRHYALSMDNFLEFWSTLAGSADEVSHLVSVLIIQYLSVVTGEDRIIPLEELVRRVVAGDERILVPVVRSEGQETVRRKEAIFRILSTLYFLVVFFDFNPQFAPLRVAMGRWKGFGASTGRETPNFVFALKLRILVQRKMEGSRADTELLRFLIVDLTANTNDDRKVGGDMLLEKSCGGLLGAFMSLLTTESAQVPCASILLSRIRRDMSESNLVLICSMLRRQLQTSPFWDRQELEELVRTLRPFVMLPLPCGKIVAKLLKVLALELRAPGIVWRRHLEAHFPVLCAQEGTGLERAAAVFCASNSALARLLVAVKPKNVTDKDLLRDCVYCLFRAVGLFQGDSELGAKLLQDMGIFSEKKVASLYAKVRDAQEKALLCESDEEALGHCRARLEQLKRASEKHILREQRTSSLRSSLGNARMLSLDRMSYNFMVNRVNFDNQLVGRVGKKWPRRNMHKGLADLVDEHLRAFDKGTGAKGKKNRFATRILLEGGDAEFHQFLSSYVSLVDNDPTILEKLDIKLYLLPLQQHGGNKLVKFLCDVDPWYHKTVAQGLSAAISVAPALANDEENLGGRGGGSVRPSLSPAGLARAMVGEYLEMARGRNKLKVFSCECWQKSLVQGGTETGASKYVIPFAIDAVLGLGAEARMFQRQKDLPASMSVGEILRCKGFKEKAPSLCVKLISVSLRGATHAEPDWDARPYEEMYFGVLPVHGAPCDRAFVSNSWMEMSADESGTKKKKGKRSTEAKYHVRKAEIEAAGKTSFSIVLDGVVYGPFLKVVLSPCNVVGQDPLEVQVMSYN